MNRLIEGEDYRSTFEQPDGPTVTIDDFILAALNKGAVDPLNAGRLLANSICADSDEISSRLIILNDEHDGDPVDDRIVAPLLRVAQDFRDEAVLVSLGPGCPRSVQDVWAINEATDEVEFKPAPGMKTVFSPRLISIVTLRDNAILARKVRGFQEKRIKAAAMRFALGLSVFDTEYTNNLQPITAAHRNYVEVFDIAGY